MSRFRLDPTNKGDFERGNRVIREIETMAPVCLAYGKDAAEAILMRLNRAEALEALVAASERAVNAMTGGSAEKALRAALRRVREAK